MVVKAKPQLRSDTWFVPIKLPSIKGRVRRMAHYYQDRTPKADLHAPVPIVLSTIYQAKRGKLVKLGGSEGITIRCYTIPDMAKLFNRTTGTIRAWYANGYLPPCFITRIISSSPSPLWTAGQVYAIARVMNDILRQGYRTIPWKYCQEHLRMMHAGCARAIERLNARPENMARKRLRANFGVEFM